MSGIMASSASPAATLLDGVPIADLNAWHLRRARRGRAWGHRWQTGEGQHVEATLPESALAYTVWETGLISRSAKVASRAARATASRRRTRRCEPATATSSSASAIRIVGALLRGARAAALRNDPRFRDPIARLTNPTS